MNKFYGEFAASAENMKAETPAMIQGFGTLFAKTMAEGAITSKEKELLAVGIGVAIQCTPCIRLHVKKCLDAGAAKEQILEAASIAVMMSGGPGYTHVPLTVEALEALEQ